MTVKLNSLKVESQIARQKDCLFVTGKRETVNFLAVDSCCNSCSSCRRVATKERCKSRHCSSSRKKICEQCFLCRSHEFCNKYHKCSNCCSGSTCRGKIAPVLGKVDSTGGQSKSYNSPQVRLHSLLLVLAKFDKITHRHKLLCQSPQEALHRKLYLSEALHQLMNKNAVEPVATQTFLGFYYKLFLVPKPNNQWRSILDLSTLNKFLKTESFQLETPETIRTSLQVGEWVTSIDFKDTSKY